MEKLLNCEVAQGIFSGEWSVTFESSDGKEISLFADGYFVEMAEEPNGEAVAGHLRVKVVSEDDDGALVLLPGSSLANPRVRVAAGMLTGL